MTWRPRVAIPDTVEAVRGRVGGPALHRVYLPETYPVYMQFSRAVSGTALDPVMLEKMRLRSARATQCVI